MQGIDLGEEDDGFTDVKIGKASFSVDLFKTAGELYELHVKHRQGGTDVQFFSAVIEYMQGIGLPAVSHRAAQRFVEHVWERKQQLGEGSGSGVKSPDSSPEPTPQS
jgi:hypothetical protein